MMEIKKQRHNQMPQKHYLGVLARAAWFAYLSPEEADSLYSKFLKKLDCSLLDEVSNKILAFSDLMSVMASSPTYIHSPIEDTDCYIIETKDNELWVIWRGTQATTEDGFSLRDLYADIRFRLTQCPFLPGNRLRLHAGFLGKYRTMRHIILDEICKLIAIRRDSSEDLITIRCIGHSLGGALAMINAADLSRFLRRKWNNNVHIACCTFGSPAAGNRSFANYFNENVPDSTRVTVHDDPIIYLPCFPWFSHVNGEVCVRGNHSYIHWFIATAIKAILNHHMIVYIHGSDCYDGKRIPLRSHTTFKIMAEAFLKMILIYAIILIVLHMDKIMIFTYLAVFICDIFDNHYQSVKKYIARDLYRSETTFIRRASSSKNSMAPRSFK